MDAETPDEMFWRLIREGYSYEQAELWSLRHKQGQEEAR